MSGSFRAQELAKLIQSSSDSLLNLINDILDLTRIESGKLQLEYVNFEPRNVVEDALDSVSSIASSKGLEMICFMDPKLPHTVRGDADRLKQMLLNLLSKHGFSASCDLIYLPIDFQTEAQYSRGTTGGHHRGIGNQYDWPP